MSKNKDLYRVKFIIDNPIRVCDYDGYPFELVTKIVSNLEGRKDISLLTVHHLGEDELNQPIHESHGYLDDNEFKTIGEYFHSTEYQELIKRLWYRDTN
jgi:hypothetical protein